MGLNAGPVPPRVDEHLKAGLLDLVDHAVGRGWSARRAVGMLGLDHVRWGRWAARRAAGQLVDRAPGGQPLHGLLSWERAAIVDLFQAWGESDRSHRKLAHRGSRLDLGACHANCVSYGWAKIVRCDYHTAGKGPLCESGHCYRRS